MFHEKLDDNTYLKYLEDHHAEEVLAVINENRSHFEEWIDRFTQITTLTDVREMILSCSKNYLLDKQIIAGIWQNNKFVGVVGLHPVNWRHKKSMSTIWLAKNVEGKGLGIRALAFMTNYGFEVLKLNRVEAVVCVQNSKCLKMCDVVGYKIEGNMRHSEILHGEPRDHYLLSVLAHEWVNK